ncbi:polyketide synthase 2 [Strongylocentrotus purpuratus]|uniref:oleoyl-[acyl-carrier-protein] hydrolase n=1 Tax=Strongylocentrotus purpuratus TaxID=7668 RepID=G8I092_STRPU|nr:polyketide synthase 2 [Strongylocentrotus purpuratus]AEQ94271.1 polyketide synthase 2 [Strongylocentrotus purpuratus]|eukprot:NP_001239013.1 polyketide synthase 2 [Strongylocentrotus purpuratus]
MDDSWRGATGGHRSRSGTLRGAFSLSRGARLTKTVSQEITGKKHKAAIMSSIDDPTMPIDKKVAIVGIGCRYANGINGVRKFWEMLAKGMDCTTPPPSDRFDSSFFLFPGSKIQGKMYNKCAGYLSQNPEHFDRQFFRISPEEANHLDPQIRMLLEVVWESLQDAGIPAHSARGSKTGVYMGVTASEYGVLIGMPNDNINQYTNSGTNSCMTANRVSYEFDFRGPSFTVDTACSSSMYSVHLACEALKNGQCEMAVAGGVNVSLLPITSIGFCQAGMLAPDGKCKSFDKSADGYARGEGVGAVILKPLQRAIDDGDRIYGVIRGGAIANDGRTPGIALPSYDGQVSLIENAYKNANTLPEEVVYVEAHGTGTQVGDRTEASAIGEAMGLNRKVEQPPLYLGSVKSNFGHSEGAAGIAGVIKAALCLYHEQIPKVVHFRSGNESVDFESLNIRVPGELTRWPKAAKKLVGCSSFGFGGANAHIVLEGYQQGTNRNERSYSSHGSNERDSGKPSILFLSAASKDALKQHLEEWGSYLNEVIGNDTRAYNNALYTAAVRSTHHQFRMGIIARSPRDATEQVRLKIDQDPRVSYNVIEGKAPEPHLSVHRLVFVFSGMGSQWWAMARQLMDDDVHFRNIIKRIDKILTKCGAKWSLIHLLTREADREKINQTEIAQPCICAVQIGMAEFYRIRGITPDAIVGHSVGEVAAAHAAGLLALEDAIRLIYTRGRQLRKTSGMGSMVAILHSAEEIQARLESSEYVSVIDVAAINSPSQIVLSGDKESLAAFSENLRREGIRCVTLKVNNAFHSYQQEEIRKDFLKKVKFLDSAAARENFNMIPVVPLISTVSNQYLDRDQVNSAAYWWKNVRQPVQFKMAIEKLLQDGYNCFLEISPHPVLSPAIRDTLGTSVMNNSNVFVTGSLRRPSDTREVADDRVNLLRSMAKLHVEGYPFDLHHLFQEGPYKVMSLPSYPWQRVLCSATTQKSHKMFRFPISCHPLLGKQQHLSHFSGENSPRVWRSKFSKSTVPWLRDHKLQGNIVIPAAAHTETMIAAAREVYPDSEVVTLRDVKFERFVFASELEGVLEISLETRSREALFALRSYNQTDRSWTLHSKSSIDAPGKVRNSIHQIEEGFHSVKLATDDIRRKCPYETDQQEFYARLWRGGFHLGETFKCVNTAYFSHDYNEALLYASVPEALEREFKLYNFHPALFDSVFQGFGICQMFQEQEKARTTNSNFRTWFQVPRSVRKIHMKGKAPTQMAFHVKMTKANGITYGNAVVADATNQRVFAQVDSMMFENVHSNEPEERVQLWRREWVPFHIEVDDSALRVPQKVPPPTRPLSAIGSEAPGAIIIIKDKQGVSMELKRRMEVESVVSVLDPRILIDGDERFRRVLRSLGMVTDLILLSPLDVKQFGAIGGISKQSFEESQTMTALSPISLYRAVSRHDTKPKPRLWVITRGAHSVMDVDVVDPMMAPAGSFGLTLMHEDPEFPVVTVDLPSLQEPEESAHWLYQYMKSAPNEENYVALRRKVPAPAGDDPKELAFEAHAMRIIMQPQSSFSAPTLSTNWQVDLNESLKQKRLTVKQSHEMPAKTSDKELAIKVTAFSVQQLVDANDRKVGCGYLYAGKILSCSEEVQVMFRMRTNVLGFRTGNQITASLHAKTSDLIPIPANLTPIEAINIVRDYLPAFVAFHDTLKLTENGTVIVCLSSLSDRVGLATTHLALEQGATVFIHVESDDGNILPVEKLLGILGDSRVVITSNENFNTLINDFSVDVLLFAGELPHDTSSLKRLVGKLRPFGTIVQIHGRDAVAGDSRISNLPPNIYFLSIDMALGRFEDMRARMQDAMSRLLHLFSVHNGFQALKSLTVPTAPISKLARSPHASLEEITVNIDEDSIPATLNFDDIHFTANPKASFLVTGGSKGFGLSMVEWLVQCGARHVYVISRNTPEEETILKFKSFRDSGARITHLKVDMGREHEVEKALLAIKDNEDQPLEGIFHCATVYNDAILRHMTTEAWNDVMIPKAYGSLILHQLTTKLGFPIKYFVMMSSIVEMIGNEGQGSYCAANSFLSALCSMRRKIGLPATLLCPGVINTHGHAAREGFVKRWENVGLGSLPPSEILKGLGCILATDYPELGLTGAVDRREYARAFSVMLSHHFSEPGGTFSILKSLFPNRDTFLAADTDIRMRIRLLTPTEAKGVIFATLSTHLVERLGLSGDVSQDATPMSLGLDSHMSTELSSIIHENFGVTLTAMELLNDSLTLGSLTDTIYERVLSCDDEGEEASTQITPTLNIRSEMWYRIEDNLDTPAAQLICFPSVGGGPTMFLPWKSHLAEYDIQMITTHLPGWERREHEKPLHNINDIVSKLAEALMPRLLQGRFAFFGHSLGGLIAFELAHYLWKNFNVYPAHIFISAWYAPTLPYPHPEELEVTGDVYRKMQRILTSHLDSTRTPLPDAMPIKFSFLDQSVMNNVRLMTRLIPSIEAAIITCKKYRFRHKDKLPCQMTVFGGKSDPFVNPSLLDDWSKQISPESRFRKVLYPGKHMYILSASKHLLKEIMIAMRVMQTNQQPPSTPPPIPVADVRPLSASPTVASAPPDPSEAEHKPVPKPRKTSFS